jgi:hypothetical protein
MIFVDWIAMTFTLFRNVALQGRNGGRIAATMWEFFIR